MRSVDISRIEIDADGRLLVFAATSGADGFDFVYRAGAEVGWDGAGYFYTPAPREWSYRRWLQQVRRAVREELGVALVASPGVEFLGLSSSDEAQLREELGVSA